MAFENTPAGAPTRREMENSDALAPEESWCQIRVRGHLGNDWSDWFGGMKLQRSQDGEMILSGYIEDQGALIGVLSKLNRLNLVLTFIRWFQETR